MDVVDSKALVQLRLKVQCPSDSDRIKRKELSAPVKLSIYLLPTIPMIPKHNIKSSEHQYTRNLV